MFNLTSSLRAQISCDLRADLGQAVSNRTQFCFAHRLVQIGVITLLRRDEFLRSGRGEGNDSGAYVQQDGFDVAIGPGRIGREEPEFFVSSA